MSGASELHGGLCWGSTQGILGAERDEMGIMNVGRLEKEIQFER